MIQPISCLPTAPLKKIPFPTRLGCERQGTDSIHSRHVQKSGRDASSMSVLKRGAQSRRSADRRKKPVDDAGAFLSLDTHHENVGSIVRIESSRLPGSRQMVFVLAASG